MTKKTPWFKLYASDLLAGMATLTAAERGVYITLLAAMYDSGGPVKDDRRRLARLCNTSNSVLSKALEALVETGKIQIVGGYITNKRAEMEIRNRVLLTEKSKLGGEKRQQKQRTTSETPEKKSSHTRSQKPDTRAVDKSTAGNARGARLPADWVCPPDWLSYATEKGMTHEQAEQTAEDFADYWIAKPGAQARKTDWKRTWQKWVRTEVERGRTSRPATHRPPANAAERAAANTSRRRDALRAAAEEAGGGVAGSDEEPRGARADERGPDGHIRLAYASGA